MNKSLTLAVVLSLITFVNGLWLGSLMSMMGLHVGCLREGTYKFESFILKEPIILECKAIKGK